MQISRIKVMLAAGAAALGWSFLLAQESHNDAPAGLPVKTSYDVGSLKYTPEERKNIDLAVAYYRDCVQSHNTAIGKNFLAEDEIQHNPNDPRTPEGLMAMLHSRNPHVDPPHKQLDPLPNLILAKDNMVLLMYQEDAKNPHDPSKTYTWSRFEMLRFQNGKIAEHWDVGDRRVNSQNWKLEWCTKAGRKDCPTP